MTGIYTPGGKTPSELANDEQAKKTQLSKEQILELLEKTEKFEMGLRILCVHAPIEHRAGVIILPQDSEELKRMGAKRFMVLKPSRDVPSAMKNADWKLEAMKSEGSMPMELPVNEIAFGDYIWAAPFAGSKIPVLVTGRMLTVEVINWGDVLCIERSETN